MHATLGQQMNYHLCPDEKFIDGFIADAELLGPGKNTYLFNFNPPAKFIKNTKGQYISDSGQLKELAKTLGPDDRVFVHCLRKEAYHFCDALDEQIPVIYFFWGMDILETPPSYYKNINYDPLSLAYYHRVKHYSLTSPWKNLFQFLKDIRLKWLRPVWEKRILSTRNRFLSRIDFFCHWNEKDFEQLKAEVGMKAQFAYFFYDSGIHSPFELSVQPANENGQVKVWLGNSASLTNNHFDFLDRLDHNPVKEKVSRIICPLSYGNETYRDDLIGFAKQRFPNQFIPLVDFVPRDTYFSYLDDCDAFIMAHNRTQAAGNVFVLLMRGKKVYMKPQSTLYQLITEAGATIYTIDDFFDPQHSLAMPLSHEQIAKNQAIVHRLINEEHKAQVLKGLLNGGIVEQTEHSN